MASFRSGDAASPTSTLREHEGSRSISELIGQMDQVVKLLNEQKSTITYIHQFGVWFLGIGVILSFYYNYVLLQPILWTLCGVLFSYVALYPPKVTVVKGLVFLLGPRTRSDEQDRVALEDLPKTWQDVVVAAVGRYLSVVWRVVMFALLPSSGDAASSMYFSILYRLMFAHFYNKTILEYFPHTSRLLLKIFLFASIFAIVGFTLTSLRRSSVALKRSRQLQKSRLAAQPLERAESPPSEIRRSWTQRVLVVHDKFESAGEWVRVFLARLVLPQAHLIAALIVLLAGLCVVGTIAVWTVYAFSDEVVYMYRNLANLVRLINGYLSHFSAYTTYVNTAYVAASDWISSAVMADSASAKTRDLYEFFSFVNSHQHALVSMAKEGLVVVGPVSSSLSVEAASAALWLATTGCATISATMSNITNLPSTNLPPIHPSLQFCSLSAVSSGTISHLGNATRAIVASVNQDLDAIVENPYAVLDGFWELVEYYQEELKSGGTIAKGGDYLLTGLNYLKEIILQSGSISFAAIGSGVSIFTFLFDSVLQAVIYLTALFLLLQSNVGFYHYTAVLLHFIDPSTMLYRAVHRALRAILISSLKMAVFHAGLTWLLFSYSDFPLVCVPTIIAFILGLVPVVSPVIVAAVPLPLWAYAHDQNVWAVVTLAVCFVVWWSVGTSIYAEIPDSSVWMTTFSVGLGISLFGARGVIIGPAIATIPFALYGLGSAYISGDGSGGLSPRTRGASEGTSILRAVSAARKSRSARRHKLHKRISIEPVDPRASSAASSPANMDKLISGSDREQLFDFIMSTPKGRVAHDKKNL